MTVQQKVAWITGGGSGIGLAGAEALAAQGWRVVISGRRAEVVDEAAASLRARGGAVTARALDVGNAADVERVATELLAEHGRIDCLVNSAGLNLPKRSWADVTTEGWDQIVKINLNGLVYCIRAVLPAMRAQQDGCIVNIASWAGRHVSKLTGPAYTATKHAVVALTHSLNMEEFRHGIRACALSPGEVATPILKSRPVPPSVEDMARMLQPEDLGRTIAFVATMPPHVCVNEILISPTWNRSFAGNGP
ncbi:SDR family oxidoreductase [Bradyrhizobium sp. WD16]|uniref:SDR family oxidoreductase n=1 Tax=Bradyrhizobium sp. WD16 TaxID=1521768 RepID=UPI0020A5560F|nr:SDR family oxidoreductase [Bradyrhizobium sp. WD16]UTD27859.1 oxidoreductase [Bradyrhizobium sp. WD16]